MKPKANTRNALRAAAILALFTPALAACSSTAGDGGGDTTSDVPRSIITETASASTSSPASKAPPATVTETISDNPGDSSSPEAPTAPVASPENCHTGDLTVGISDQQGAAGSIIMDLIFTNVSDTNCELYGFPGASLVGTGDGSQLGAAAIREEMAPALVDLQPGETATAGLRITRAENYDAENCGLVPADGLRIYPPGNTAADFVKLEGVSGCVSQSVELLSIQPVG